MDAIELCKKWVTGVASCKVIVVPLRVAEPVCVSIPFVPMFVLVMVVVPLFCKNLVVGVASCNVIVVPVRVAEPV